MFSSTVLLNFSSCLTYVMIGDSLLHMAAASGLEEAGLFLASHGAQPNHANKHGEMPLHVASRTGLARLVLELLNK